MNINRALNIQLHLMNLHVKYFDEKTFKADNA